MCVDYREINSKTVKDRFPLPHTDDFLEKLKGCRFFYKFGPSIRLSPDSRRRNFDSKDCIRNA